MAPAKQLPERFTVTTIDTVALSKRIERDGKLFTYVLPPRGKLRLAPVTMRDALAYCEGQQTVAEHRARAAPDSDLYAHEAAVFGLLVRLIEACLASGDIKAELTRMYRERETREAAAAAAAEEAAKAKAAAEAEGIDVEAPPDADGEEVAE